VPFLAALLCAAMPVVNLLGTSAQQESLFTVLILAAAFALDANRFALGGVLLAIASTVRTETWGAIGLLAGLRALGFVFPRFTDRLPSPIARACRLPLVIVVPGLLAVAAWFLAHRLSDGSWLAFVRETHRYTHLQRATFHQESWAASRWFLVSEPYYLFGLTLPLFFLGLHRAFRPGFFIPLGLYLFLLVSWFSGSALDHSRYYESVAPFVCLAAAHGMALIGERWRTAVPVLFTAAFAHVVWLLVLLGRATFHL
jgi:Gpi18-like mannosyltransferase